MIIKTDISRSARGWLADRNTLFAAEATFVILVIIWGITFVVSRNALQVIGPFGYNTLRMGVGAVTLALLTGSRWRQLERSYIAPTMVTGFILFVSYAAQAYGQQFTTASKAGFLTGSSIIYVPLLAAVFLRQRPPRMTLMGVVLAFIGMITISVEGSLTTLALSWGDSWVAASGIGWAAYIIALAHYAPRVRAMLLATLHVGFAAVLSGIGWVFMEPMTVPWESAALWMGVLTTGFLILGIGTSIQTWVTRQVPATRVALIAATEPIFAAVAGWFVGETITMQLLIGGLLILSGVFLSEKAH
ncbi:MAG: DMT family transporter [Anaerolineales bacterium]|nr:DMT family transporter [Anaerolineales bacterium]